MATTDDLTNKAKDLKNQADNFNPDHKEGPVAAAIEQYTAKLPSDLFLWAALGSMAVSAILKVMRKDEEALFVGQWPAPFLILGLYNKIVKVEGTDGEKNGDSRGGARNMGTNLNRGF